MIIAPTTNEPTNCAVAERVYLGSSLYRVPQNGILKRSFDGSRHLCFGKESSLLCCCCLREGKQLRSVPYMYATDSAVSFSLRFVKK